ncbi:undecaprenyl-diphosphate phosphatase [Patescibacteria group bacterium]
MSILTGIALGIIQGVTEFLPVSSSGHLVIFQIILGIKEPPIFFDVLVHIATLFAVLIYFRKSILKIDKKTIGLIIIGTIPAVVVGLAIKPIIESIFSSLWIVGFGLIYTGTIMASTKKLINNKTTEGNSPKKALIIGLFQSLALIPGISRSGSTVFAGLKNNLSKKDSFEFSFILAIPAILGALILEVLEFSSISINASQAAGFFSALVTGMISLKILEKIIQNKKLHYFGYYCLAIGVLLTGFNLIK